mmetsp:Transcript_9919/g.22070  ORF Transcript_9919/g.22070 Transcript_9919/m.22070 type:complete len:237 (+) Transcript_9919:455-1165(+)
MGSTSATVQNSWKRIRPPTLFSRGSSRNLECALLTNSKSASLSTTNKTIIFFFSSRTVISFCLWKAVRSRPATLPAIACFSFMPSRSLTLLISLCMSTTPGLGCSTRVRNSFRDTCPSPSMSTMDIIMSISSSVIISPMHTRMCRISAAPTKLLWSRSMNLKAARISVSVNSAGSSPNSTFSSLACASLAACSAGTSSGTVLISGLTTISPAATSTSLGAMRSWSSNESISGRYCG